MTCLGLLIQGQSTYADAVLDYPPEDSPIIHPVYPDLVDQIPRLIDKAPDILPAESDTVIVPPTEVTQDHSWFDIQQKKISDWADRSAEKMNHWFGTPEPGQPASASLRVIVDTKWNQYDDFKFNPRIKGKIKLPTLENRLSLVFGDDSLDNELENNVAISDELPAQQSNAKLDRKQVKEENNSIALRWSTFSKRLPFETDLDLGLRSGDDLFTRLKLSRYWQLENDFSFQAEQIYRYGLQSKNYLRTNLDFTHARPDNPLLSNQFNIIYADQQDDDLTWNNYSFRQHQFFHDHRFSYGLYTGGYINDTKARLNRWGPYISWRQPVLREWFFVQTDVNYLNDKREDRDHYLGATLRLEAFF
ncbi:hypothetical protein A3K93_00890 [Acinetobacter sp. NCu2D-2]|uniref:hypothetical protein n=1 Tax=Acinetobacter sp. NCu2D-2 TaxID=1608473 RepID=UPI0007CDFF28|nr:hypothetical protein [Acinetobacter sp. NCu2D-2]ANF83060.1 hypothetical protein A3K93_00890 [Acinetobacter sp. NCu2D-2]